MCGHDWCSVRISKEIAEFDSGKADEYRRERVLKSPAINPEQRAVLERRGVLSPEEIHRLASKTRKAVLAEPGKMAACHSDIASAGAAIDMQDNLVQLRRSPAAE
jgi:phosphomethylpyrimidine synthase